MFKNMSFGKLLGVFGGFLLLMIVVAVVIVKMNQGGANGTTKQVVTKTYKRPAATASAHTAPAAQTDTPAVAGADGAGAGTGTGTGAGTGVLLSKDQAAVASAATAAGVAPAAVASVPAAPAPGTPPSQQAVMTNVPVDLGQRLASIDTTLSSLDTRVTAMESCHRCATDMPPRAKAVVRTKRRAVAAKRVVVVETPLTPLTKLPGYKSMAVVGHRAWVATPDGIEDSATRGETVPGVRVRTMDAASGVVITTSDGRIDPY